MPDEGSNPAKGKHGGTRPNSGPKPKPLDLEEVEKMAYFQATDEEIAYRFDLERSTITRRRQSDSELAEVMERGRAKGRLSLRRQQFKLAMEGNVTMLIWLGKNLLQQKDRIDGNLQIQTLSIRDIADEQLKAIVDDCRVNGLLPPADTEAPMSETTIDVDPDATTIQSVTERTMEPE